MAALIDADDFRERFDLDDAFEDPRITPHIASASRRLRQWVGDTHYDGALADAAIEDEEDQDDPARLNALQNAEAHLTYHYAVLGFNNPLSHKGIVATAMSDEGKEMRKYLTPDQTAAVASQFLELAEQMAREYLQSSDLPPGPVVNEDVDDITWPVV